ncbi:MAG TPA: alpha/beta fold hydrolase [Phycisphaerae bacterium]
MNSVFAQLTRGLFLIAFVFVSPLSAQPTPATHPAPAINLPPRPEPPPLPHYERSGRGSQAIVLLHGLASDSRIWTETAAALSEPRASARAPEGESRRNNYTVVSVDFRGHGQTPPSAVPPRASPLGQLKNDVRAVVEKEQLGRVILIAHDMGGLVALQYAQSFPEQTRMVILVDTALQPLMSKEDLAKTLGSLSTNPRAVLESLYSGADVSTNADTVTRVRDQARQTDPQFFAVLDKDVLTSLMSAVFQQVRLPVRLIYREAEPSGEPGSNAPTSAPDYVSKLGYVNGKDFRARRLEHVGHFIMLDDPSGFRSAVSEFLSELPPALDTSSPGAPEWTATASGLKYHDVTVGDGPAPSPHAIVKIDYQAWHLDGDELPLLLGPAGAPPLWLDSPSINPAVKEALPEMKLGGERKLLVPPDMQRNPPFRNMPALGQPVVVRLKLLGITEPPLLPTLAPEKQTTTASGLKYVDVVTGDGPAATANSVVKFNFRMWLADGKYLPSRDPTQVSDPNPFDNPPATLSVANLAQQEMLRGAAEALSGMRVGGKRVAVIPPELAYGSNERPLVPANSTIVMDFELLEVVPTPDFELPADNELTTLPATGPPARPAGPSEPPTQVGGATIRYKNLKPGDGDPIAPNAVVTMNVKGWELRDGQPREIENSYARGGARMALAQTVPDWMEGVRSMRIGGRRLIVVTPPPPPATQSAETAPAPAPTKVYSVEVVSAITPPAFQLPTDAELTTTPSGLKYKDLKTGEGETPAPDAQVRAHYVGWLTNGVQFDSSYDRGQPQLFALNAPGAPGFLEGLRTMKVGGRRLLIVPPELAFGDKPPPRSKIPVNAILVFDVELREIVTPQSQP